MPEQKTTQRAKEDLRQGKRPSTAAGEFVREEIHHVREGKHGARNTKQAIAIGLSKARRSGVPLPAPEPGKTSDRARRSAKRDLEASQSDSKPSPKRSRATTKALKREPKRAASKAALSRQAKSTAAKRRRTAQQHGSP